MFIIEAIGHAGSKISFAANQSLPRASCRICFPVPIIHLEEHFLQACYKRCGSVNNPVWNWYVFATEKVVHHVKDIRKKKIDMRRSFVQILNPRFTECGLLFKNGKERTVTLKVIFLGEYEFKCEFILRFELYCGMC